MGVKRRVLQVLAGMGICETYHTINKLNESIAANGLNHLATAGSRPDAIIVYDNFDYHEQVRHQRVGDHGDLKSVTSGKVIVTKRGRDVAIYKSQVIKLLNITAALSASRL